MFHIFSFLVLLLSLFVSYRIFNSMAELKVKVLWIAFVLIIPPVGIFAWYFLGPGDKESPF